MMIFEDVLKEYVNRCNHNASICYTKNGSKRIISADEFYIHVMNAKEYFANMGIGKRIGIVGENSYEYLVIMFGIICSGNIAVPINNTYADDMLLMFFEKTQVSMVICDEEYLDGLKEVGVKIPLYDMEEVGDRIVNEKIILGDTEYVSKDDDVILMLLSSGTSGVSKVVQITNGNLSVFPKRVMEWELNEPQNSLLLLPFYHISGIIPLLEELIKGNVTYISSAKYIIRDISQNEINKLLLVPSMLKKILQQCDKSKEFAESCKSVREALCLGAALDESLVSHMSKYDIMPKTYYGMTETTGTVSGEGEYRFGACGKVSPFCQVKIQEGEILVKGPNVMKGYFGETEETLKIMDDGWIHTGDLGEIDEDGYLYVRGRKKNIIILSNGENVCPEELENNLYKCNLIEECKVYGEENICAEIFCGNELDEEKEALVKEHIRKINRMLPPSHKIKNIYFVTTPMQRNSMGKIVR